MFDWDDALNSWPATPHTPPQFPGLVNTGTTDNQHYPRPWTQVVSTRSGPPQHRHRLSPSSSPVYCSSGTKNCLRFCGPPCGHSLVLTSVSVFLPPPVPGADQSPHGGVDGGGSSLVGGGDRLSVGLGDLSPVGDVVGGVLRVGWIGTGITDWTLPKRLGSSAVTLRASLSGTFLHRRKDVVNQCSEFAVRCLLGRIANQRYGARLFPWTSGALGGMGLGCDWSQGSGGWGWGGGGQRLRRRQGWCRQGMMGQLPPLPIVL